MLDYAKIDYCSEGLGMVSVVAGQRVEVDEASSVPALELMLDWAGRILDSVGDGPRAMVGRIRGAGPGASFGRLIERLECEHPVEMRRPFENTHSVAGGIWRSVESSNALMKLQFDRGTGELPMHAHLNSARVIFVAEGRGFFHVSDQTVEGFEGSDVRPVPVRSRDVLVFHAGIMHTFSAPDEDLVLLSFHAPFINLDDPRQYTLPECVWRPADHAHSTKLIGCDPAWTMIAHCGGY